MGCDVVGEMINYVYVVVNNFFEILVILEVVSFFVVL